MLRGKLALITGGSGTIGRAIAAKFLEQGASVVLVARNVERLVQAKQHLSWLGSQWDETHSASETGVTTLPMSAERILILACDVSNESSVVDLFETIDRTYPTHPSIDILVNNAGINIPGETTQLSVTDFDTVMRVNVTGPFVCAREAMKRMKQSTPHKEHYVGGRIINVGSISAYSPRPDSCPYTTSKFALLGLTKSLALDGRRYGISVGIIHPGNVESDLLTDEMKRQRRETEGFLSADDVADCVVTMACLPPTANVLEMTVLPSRQPFVGRG